MDSPASTFRIRSRTSSTGSTFRAASCTPRVSFPQRLRRSGSDFRQRNSLQRDRDHSVYPLRIIRLHHPVPPILPSQEPSELMIPSVHSQSASCPDSRFEHVILHRPQSCRRHGLPMVPCEKLLCLLLDPRSTVRCPPVFDKVGPIPVDVAAQVSDSVYDQQLIQRSRTTKHVAEICFDGLSSVFVVRDSSGGTPVTRY